MADILDTRFEGKTVAIGDNIARVGDDINLLLKDPALRKVRVAMGWDLNAFDGVAIDLDVSLFLLGKGDKTRVDEDFVFYNNKEILDGAVRHTGDSRTGAGDGDDESVIIDLTGVPYDVFRIVFALSIYRGDEKQQRLGQIRNAFLRIVNDETGIEILRYPLANMEERLEAAMIVGFLNREGPKWHFVPQADFKEGGLASIATGYGIIVVHQ